MPTTEPADSPLFGDLSGGDAAVLGAGALGLGAMALRGPSALPPQFDQLASRVPGLDQNAATVFQQGQQVYGQGAPIIAQGGQVFGQGGQVFGQGAPILAKGSAMVGQGQEALARAERGELTPEQTAQLKLMSSGLNNQTRQQFANMGLSPDQSTSEITQTGLNETQVLAAAQSMIQTSLQSAFGQISAGTQLQGQGLGAEAQGIAAEGAGLASEGAGIGAETSGIQAENSSLAFNQAANNLLYQGGQAQLQQDKSFSDSMTSAFSAFAKIAGVLLA